LLDPGPGEAWPYQPPVVVDVEVGSVQVYVYEPVELEYVQV
jgi:hypothetical protein